MLPTSAGSSLADESVAQMVDLPDVQDASPAARRLRDWAIEAAAIRPGDQVVDLGSGTGTITRQRDGWFRRATQQIARWAGIAESDRSPVGSSTHSRGRPKARLREVSLM